MRPSPDQNDSVTATPPSLSSDSDYSLRAALAGFPGVLLALVLGSVAQGRATQSSDLDIAVIAHQALTADQKMSIIAALAAKTGRPIDLIDLTTVGEPLLSQIMRHGRRLLGIDSTHARWISRHLIEQADFVPLLNRILRERRATWIGK
jgi:predicted nucleotidyltransferase